MARIHHFIHWLGVMDVRGPSPVLVPIVATIGRAIPVQVSILHPEADLGGPPVATQLGSYCDDAPPCDEGVLNRGVRWMRDVAHVKDPKPSLPIGPIHVGLAEARVIWIVPRPCLYGHVVDVYPPTQSCLPVHLGLAHLEDDWLVAGPVEVQVRDGYAPARVSLSDIARVVVRVGDEDVPLSVDDMGVEVVRAAGVVGVIPSTDPLGVLLVSHFDECDGHLSRIFPRTHIRVCSPRIDQLVLEHDVLASIVLDVLDIQNLRVGVVVFPHPRRVLGVCDVDYVHLRPPSDVGVYIAVRGLSHLNLGVPGLSQRIIAQGLYVRGREHVLTSIPVVVAIVLQQRVDDAAGEFCICASFAFEK